VGGPSSGLTCTQSGTFNSTTNCICNNCYGPQFLRNSVWGGYGTLGRLNTIGVWTTESPINNNFPPLNEWIGFSYCVDIPTSDTYYIGLAADNEYRFKINGQIIVDTSIGTLVTNTFAQYKGFLRGIQFPYWSVFAFTFNPGFNIIEMEGLNTAGPGGFGVEIYSGSLSAITAVTTTTQLSALTIFSSGDLIGQPFDLSETGGYSCPEGYSLVLCDGPPYCVLIEQTPCVNDPSPTPSMTPTPTPTPTPYPQPAYVPVNECEPITLLTMSASCEIVNVTNNTGSTKSMVVTITGGTSPYIITWSNGSITSGISPQSINNLSAGTYTATIVDYWGDFTATTTCSIPKNAVTCQDVEIILKSDVTCSVIGDVGTGTGFIDFTPNGGTPPYTYSGNVNGSPTTITNPLIVNDKDVVNVIVTDYNGCVSSVYTTIVSCPSGSQPLNCTTTNCPNGNTFVFDISATTIGSSVLFQANLSSSSTTSVKGSYKITNVDFPNTFLSSPGVLSRTKYYSGSNGAPIIELSNYLEIGFNQLTPINLTNSDSPWELLVTPYPTFGAYTQPTPFTPGTNLTIEVVLYDEDFCVYSSSDILVIPNESLTNSISISL
jgi:hypothetical protein